VELSVGDAMRRHREKQGPKARLAAKLAEIRKALISAGCDSAAKQAAVLGVSRSTAWALLHLDKRAGPHAIVIKRILSSPDLPSRVRQKVEEYVRDKVAGLYGHSEQSKRAFRNKVQAKL
jgi:hypothetical protein